MTDTGKKRYSIDESINRIVRAIKGAVAPSDAPETLSGTVLSIDEALSELAELAENKLAGENPQVPAGWTVPIAGIQDATETQKGVAELATTAEAQTGTDTTRITTPAGVLASILNNTVQTVEIAEIYNTSTGTPVLSMSTSWQKVTGSFQGNGAFSDHFTPDYANDRIILNKTGTFFVGVFPSFSGGTSAIFSGAIYLDGVRQDNIRFRRRLSTGGDVGSTGALGTIIVTGTPVAVELYVKADIGTPNFKLEAGQIFVFGIVQE